MAVTRIVFPHFQSVAVIIEIKHEIINRFKYVPLRFGFSFFAVG